MTAKWFSRHSPTDGQLAEIGRLGYSLPPAEIVAGMVAGVVELATDEDVAAVVTAITAGDPVGVFGVFPTPILAALRDGRPVLFAAWNVRRTVSGGPATFDHLRWMVVGGGR